MKACKAPTCALRGLEVRTDLTACLGCGEDLPTASPTGFGDLLDDIFGKGWNFDVRGGK